MTNPFLVQPANIGNQAASFGQGLANYGQVKKQEQKEQANLLKQQEAKKETQAVLGEMEEAYANKDYDAIAIISMRYPQMGQAVMKAIDAQDDRVQSNIVDRGFELLTNPDDYERIINDNPKFAEALGGRDSLIESFRDEPGQAIDVAKNFLAHTAGDRYIKYKKAISEPESKSGRFIYKDTPDGFLKVDTANGTEEELTVGSKAFKAQQDRKVKEIEAEIKAEGAVFDKSKKVRDRYDTLSKEFVKVRDAYDRIEASIEQPDAAGDIALIFNYMKMLDPGSVVREGEFATAQNAGGVDDSVRNMYNKLADGERLQPKQREMFASRANKLFKKANNSNQKVRAETLNIGKQYGLTEQNIFGDGSIYPAGDKAGITATPASEMSDEDLAKSLGL